MIPTLKKSELDDDLRNIHVLKTVSGVYYYQLVLTYEQFERFLNKKSFTLNNEEMFSLSTKKEGEDSEIGELVRLRFIFRIDIYLKHYK